MCKAQCVLVVALLVGLAHSWGRIPTHVFRGARRVQTSGSSCSWRGLQGRCTVIYNCQSALEAIRQKNPPPICRFKGTTPVVCCTSCNPNQGVTDPSNNLGIDSRFNQTSKARNYCLNYLKTLEYPCRMNVIHRNEERSSNCNMAAPLGNGGHSGSLENLIGRLSRHAENQRDDDLPHTTRAPRQISHGLEAHRRQYPHMALLGYGYDLQSAQWLCGGSVISEKYILTAGHCISSPRVGSAKFIALGILKRSDPLEMWQTYNVKRIIAHPDYKSPSKYNDIALLETEDPISFNSDVLPACLPLVPESDLTAEATGWGDLGNRQGLADTLQTVTLQRYDEEKCSQLYPRHRHLRAGYNNTIQMCYGDPLIVKDTCQGDSGGPLQTANQFSRCAYTVLGVTSYGRKCGISGSGMYTRVSHYVPWIESIVWP